MDSHAAYNYDWADTTLRDPIVFFALVVPFMISAVVGLARYTRWGRA